MAREAGIEFQHITGILGKETISTMGSQRLERIEQLVALVRADERDRAMRENAYVQAEREALIGLLKGIDKTEIESADGWWETSSGAEFGAGILAAIRARGNT
jgi:hypothetical protein